MKPTLERHKGYLLGTDKYAHLVTVYEFTYRGVEFYVAHDMRNDKYWNVYDPETGRALWNQGARKSRKDALAFFTSPEKANVNRFIHFLEMKKTDWYLKMRDEWYQIVRNEEGGTYHVAVSD